LGADEQNATSAEQTTPLLKLLLRVAQNSPILR
jgi:hypothetical protein